MSSLIGILRESLESNKKAFDSEFKNLHFDITQFLMLGSDFNILRMFDLDIFLNSVHNHIREVKDQISYYENMINILYQKRKECSILGECNKEKKVFEDFHVYKEYIKNNEE